MGAPILSLAFTLCEMGCHCRVPRRVRSATITLPIRHRGQGEKRETSYETEDNLGKMVSWTNNKGGDEKGSYFGDIVFISRTTDLPLAEMRGSELVLGVC